MKNYLIYILFVTLAFSCKKNKTPENINDNTSEPTPYSIEVPNGFSQPFPSIDNPLTVEGIELGRHLFYEKMLSRDNTQSCGSCHQQEFAFTDPRQFSIGITGESGNRNSMAIQNVAWGNAFFWDERAKTLEEQALEPITNPIEMDATWPEVSQKLQNSEFYPPKFLKAFGTNKIDSTLVAKALAQFMKTLISSDSKYDKWKKGETTFTPEEEYGYYLFNSEGVTDGLPPGTGADCFHCHIETGGQFAILQAQNNGLDATHENDLGLAAVTGYNSDIGRFKVPSLRNIEFTAPYMHDGRFNSLEDVVEHYNSGGHWSPTVSNFMKYTNGGLVLDQAQKEALIAFLKTLSDESFINNESLSDPNN